MLQGEEVCRLFDQDSGADAVAIASIQRGELARRAAPSELCQDEIDWLHLHRIMQPDLFVGVPPVHGVSGRISLNCYGQPAEVPLPDYHIK